MPKTASNDPRAAPNWPVLRERLWVTALALTRSREDADDLTQQTFATLLAKQPSRVDHTAYARRTMVRLWLDQQRSMRRRARRTAQWALAARRRHTDSDRIADDERYERARQAIKTLPPRQHAIAVLRLVEDLDYGEIASLLDCPVQAVRASLHVARERVRRLIGESP